jgi:diadenosine tetraphosphate (Ap4A) HIT family hydrolase
MYIDLVLVVEVMVETMEQNIFEVFDEKNNLIKEYEHWKLLMRRKYMSLGNCVLIIKRPIERFSDATAAEMEEYGRIVKDVESALKKVWNYDKINWLMLMMKDKQVHFHIVPRYAEKRDFAGKEWIDTGWPSWPVTSGPTDQALLDTMKQEILKHLNE